MFCAHVCEQKHLRGEGPNRSTAVSIKSQKKDVAKGAQRHAGENMVV